MKKLLFFVFFVALVSLAFAKDKDSTRLERKNVIKFLPANIPLQSLSFEYERMINGKNSFTLGVGLPQQQSLIGKYGIKGDKDLKSAELGTMHIRAAYRHYGGQSMLPRGFYIEPYLKYQKITGNAGIKSTSTTKPFEGTLDLNLNTMNFGFQLGAQFLIAKRVSLDFYFLGLEAGLLSGNVTVISESLADPNAANLKANIDDAIADLPSFIGDKLTVTQSSDKKTIGVKASSVPYPWLRGGISIGIAF
ncbi:MAG: hypothetical protein NTY07_13730 [Bacteroidia bacterium]|nr:hypothetical protein [Bacteroidia bacterium]